MPVVALILIGINVAVSIAGFQNRRFFDRYAFSVGNIIQNRQYERIMVSTFLHVDIIHLLFNMFSFYSFAFHLEQLMGRVLLLVLFFGSALGGDLLALVIHRKQPGYRAAGASGAVSGVIFASVLLLPGGRIMIFPIPVGIPPWLFAIIFVLISIYGIGKQAGNIGHEAHLGGALTGLLITGILYPVALEEHLLLSMGLIIVILAFLVRFIKKG